MDSTARTHLHQAHDSLRHAADAAHHRMVERLVPDDVRNHLRQAARHVLHAGLAVLDAADRRHAHAAPAQPAAAAPHPATPAG